MQMFFIGKIIPTQTRSWLIAAHIAIGSFIAGTLPCFGVVLGWPANAPGEERGEGFFSVSEEVVTPHTQWAKPYVRGATKALFIVPRWGAREVMELAQRMDLQYDVVMVGGKGIFCAASEDETTRLNYSAERPRQVLSRLNAKLSNDYEVIILGNVWAQALPETVWSKIVAKVHAGAGLLVTDNAPTNPPLAVLLTAATPEPVPPAILAALPETVLPLMKSVTNVAGTNLPPVACYRVGTGRLLVAHYDVGDGNQFITPLLTLTDKRRESTLYDYYQALAVKLILWAADRLPADGIQTVTVTPAIVGRAGPEKAEVIVNLGQQGRQASVTVHARLREANDRMAMEVGQLAGGDRLVFPIAKTNLPVGRYYADVWLNDAQGRVCDWATARFAVAAPQEIVSLTATDRATMPAGTVSGKITLKKPLAANEQLHLEARDYFSRLTAAEMLAGGGQTEVAYRLSIGHVLSLITRLRAVVRQDGLIVDEQTIEIPVRQPACGFGWDDFSFMVWSFNNYYIRHFADERLVKAGMDRLMTSFSGPERHIQLAPIIADEYNCRVFPYATRITKEEQCRSEPLRALFTKLAQGLEPYSCDTFSLGDECGLFSITNETLDTAWLNRGFQDYLKVRYSSLELLNEEWDTSFKSWNMVRGIRLKDALVTNQPARWVDHRMHRNAVYAGAMRVSQETVAQINPAARAGFEGACLTYSYVGYDWWLLGRSLKMMGHYNLQPVEWDIMASFKQPGSYIGMWNGAYIDMSNRWCQDWQAWRCLLSGMNAVFYWGPYFRIYRGQDGAFGILYPDLRVNPANQPFLDSLAEIKTGIGKLLLTSERVYPGVAIHYSQASIHADALESIGSFAQYASGGFKVVGAGIPHRVYASWMTFDWSLKEVGLQPRFVAYEQIEQGILTDYKVLVLPFSQAISTTECAAITRFVEGGGVLVADVRPAIRDGHGKPMAKGLLDDLFGIERMTNAPAPGEPQDIAVDLTLGNRPIKGTIPLAQPDPAVKCTTGKALAKSGDVPLFIERQIGKGRTLLLNFAGNYSPGSYGKVSVPPVRTTPRGDLYMDIDLAVAELAGITPDLCITSSGERLRGMDIVAWRDGSASYYGVTANDFCDFAWVLTMPETMQLDGALTTPGFLYDVRRGRYLGQGQKFQTDLRRGSAVVVASLPYRVERVEIEGPAAAKPGETIRCSIRVVPEAVLAGTAVGRHIARVTVSANGKELNHYAANLAADKGEAVFELPLALNDAKGEWVISAKDVVSGTTGKVLVRVK